MRHSRLCLVVCAMTLSGAVLTSQITLINSAPFGSRYATTTGSAHSIDKVNVQIGAASCARVTASANSSYLNTLIALDPSANSRLCPRADKGFTIQFWYRPSAATAFQYLFGDSTWTGANGAFRCFQGGGAGFGNLRVRGPLSQGTTTGSPLTSALNAKGWVHVAVVLNNTKATVTWYVNGSQNAVGSSTVTGKGKNFTCMGYNGSSSAGTTGNFDDFRVYNWARTGADIAADYTKAASGSGPSGCLNLPDEGYYNCDAAVNPHIGKIALIKEPPATFTRLFSLNDTIEWSSTSPAKGPFAAIALINVFTGGPGSPRQDAYQLPPPLPGGPYKSFLPGLVLGSFFSTPPLAASLFWPVAVAYQNGGTGKVSVKVPNLGLVSGDRLDFQWIVIDPTYTPFGLGTTNNMTFEFVVPKGAHKVHVEARGGAAGQDTGFWEVWNTGGVAIKQVCIDFSTITTSTTWNPTGALNSGGTLATGTSLRHLTDKICDLTPKTNPRYTLTPNNQNLCFNFVCPPVAADGFQGPTNHFIFDCATNRNYTATGSGYIGATVTVTFCTNKVLTGKLIADPKDPNAAQIDL